MKQASATEMKSKVQRVDGLVKAEALDREEMLLLRVKVEHVEAERGHRGQLIQRIA